MVVALLAGRSGENIRRFQLGKSLLGAVSVADGY